MKGRHLICLLGVVLVIPLLGFGPEAEHPADAPKAEYIGDETCAECHEEQATALAGEIHMRIRPFEVRGHTVGCEGCHGPGSLHAEESDPELIKGGARSSQCMECHQTKGLPTWHASTHAMEDVGCVECHGIHEAKRPQGQCQECHADVVSRFQLPSHHPVREGLMTCGSCHDVHSATEGQLRTDQRQNDLCYTCHQMKEGPFIFEHPPVQEDCAICHVPHGAVADNLLNANEPTLCLQCHDFHFHAGYKSGEGELEIGGSHRENPFGNRSMNVAFTTNCTQCHQRIHGTDTPSQTIMGRGLLQ